MTKKRILAVLLAVMLVIGSLPLSVFAAGNGEADTSSGFTISDSSGDVPVLYAQDKAYTDRLIQFHLPSPPESY